jgi:hypothetical protein
MERARLIESHRRANPCSNHYAIRRRLAPDRRKQTRQRQLVLGLGHRPQSGDLPGWLRRVRARWFWRPAPIRDQRRPTGSGDQRSRDELLAGMGHRARHSADAWERQSLRLCARWLRRAASFPPDHGREHDAWGYHERVLGLGHCPGGLTVARLGDRRLHAGRLGRRASIRRRACNHELIHVARPGHRQGPVRGLTTGRHSQEA